MSAGSYVLKREKLVKADQACRFALSAASGSIVRPRTVSAEPAEKPLFADSDYDRLRMLSAAQRGQKGRAYMRDEALSRDFPLRPRGWPA
jgi:hypothetical protein